MLSSGRDTPLMVSLSLQMPVLVSLVTYVSTSKSVMSLCSLRPAKNTTWWGSIWKDEMAESVSKEISFSSEMMNSKMQDTQSAASTRLLREYISVARRCLQHHSCFVESQRPSWDTVPGGGCFVKPKLNATYEQGVNSLHVFHWLTGWHPQQMALGLCRAGYVTQRMSKTNKQCSLEGGWVRHTTKTV